MSVLCFCCTTPLIACDKKKHQQNAAQEKVAAPRGPTATKRDRHPGHPQPEYEQHRLPLVKCVDPAWVPRGRVPHPNHHTQPPHPPL